MIREFAHCLRTAYPVLLAVVLLLFNFQIGALGELHPTLRIPLYVTELELTLSTAWVTRIAINVLACICLLLPAFGNYSAFFCGRYEMDVFVDDAGIDDILRTLTPRELEDTNIAPAWKEDKIRELAHLNSIVETRFPGSEFRFSGRPGDLHSSGGVEFTIRKVKGAW